MTRHKKELMECARMLKLGNLTEPSGGTAASGPGKAADLSGVSTRLPQGGGPDQGEPEIFVSFESGRASCKA